MIVWIILFLGITGVAFIMALRSMRNYSEQTEHFQFRYSQFLVQEPAALNQQCLNDLYAALLPKRALISLERLAKGSKQALVIFGPVELLEPFFGRLKLLELEDYISDIDRNNVTALQLAGHPHKAPSLSTDTLSEDEQQWLQITLQPVQPGLEMTLFGMAAGRQKHPTNQSSFAAALRLVLIGPDPKKRETRSHQLSQQLSLVGLVKLPQKFTSAELLKQYEKRSLAVADAGSVIIDVPTLQSLLH